VDNTIEIHNTIRRSVIDIEDGILKNGESWTLIDSIRIINATQILGDGARSKMIRFKQTVKISDAMNEENELMSEAQRVSQAMRIYGGSFVERLGCALFYADYGNTQKIKNAFPEYWQEYLEIAECKLIGDEHDE